MSIPIQRSFSDRSRRFPASDRERLRNPASPASPPEGYRDEHEEHPFHQWADALGGVRDARIGAACDHGGEGEDEIPENIEGGGGREQENRRRHQFRSGEGAATEGFQINGRSEGLFDGQPAFGTKSVDAKASEQMPASPAREFRGDDQSGFRSARTHETLRGSRQSGLVPRMNAS